MEIAEAKKMFKAGDVIMRQGDKGDCAYIIEEGLVEILIEKDNGTIQQVGTRGEGTIIGEMAIVDDAPRTATVKALKDCKMLEITRDDFSQRLKNADPVIQMISQVILTRYRDTLTRSEILRESDNFPPPEALERSYAARTDVVESIKIANEFKAALENGDLELHYQPIINLGNGNVSGFEALMRWNHKKDGFISPGVFIPIAEKSGLIIEASKWALKEACAALGRIEKAVENSTPLYVSVNFSSHDFAEDNFVSNLLETIQNSQIKPPQIKLEITERLLIQQPDNAKETLESCRDAGVGIAIDDFGTGYSSLSYLYYFPIQVLKIDQSFIRTIYREDRSLELVKSIVGLGKNMGMEIVAEGVETLEEAELLQNMGCDSAQGYYFAKPMSEQEVIKKLCHWKPLRLSA
ncbi:MAG: cyclic nucleotide-binding protein [Alphaproteobacteria bacterium CG_4_9_14_3_um_filter_47_13]|nr:MAG: cyclic nucleotide-binding protein [Alphaproteobacteria bacterium CG_4_9_14_3_um_filter_47_13]